ETFGTGDIRGVLAPESANNAKEGGALIPTLLFGIPGSGSMAILLGGFIMVDIQPGLEMVKINLDLTYVMIWSLALANIIGAGTCLLLAGPIARLTTIPYALLAPFMIVLIFFAAFQASRNWGDLIMLFILGSLGMLMKRFGWPRPALLIGFFLAPRLEQASYLTFEAYGLSFLQRPVALGLLALVILSTYAAVKFRPSNPSEEDMKGLHGGTARGKQLAFTGFFMLVSVYVFIESMQKKMLALIFPVTVSLLTFGLLLYLIVQQARKTEPSTVFYDFDHDPSAALTGSVHYMAWIAGLLGATALIGFPLAIMAFVTTFITVKAGGSPVRNLLLGMIAIGFLGTMSYFLTLKYPDGLLQNFVPMPWWLGG
ncbi:MAG: tripartite tricarboxylate transporter permease, partial [Rhodospirillales bacterium]